MVSEKTLAIRKMFEMDFNNGRQVYFFAAGIAAKFLGGDSGKISPQDVTMRVYLKFFSRDLGEGYRYSIDPNKGLENQGFAPWFATLVKHEAIDLKRRERRYVSNESDDLFSGNYVPYLERMGAVMNETPLDILSRKEDSGIVRKAVEELEPRLRMPVILFYFENKSYEDIGKVLGIPLGTVKSRINNAKKRLKQSYELKRVA